MPDDDVKKLAESRLGHVLKGKYRLDRVLGIGGMAVVYAATHRNKKRVAIKMLHPELSIRENIRTRFLREGYVANTVDHPGAVAVHDDDVAEDGSAFVVMEYLDGAPVDQVATRHEGRVPLGLVLSIGDALLDVLSAAHAKGVIHRDIKPANLFLTTDGRLEVLDFGIARLHDETGTGATQTGAMLGTPAYMAPEQARAESSKVDGQTDLWAAGATLFVLLTGQLVHEGENASQLLIAAGTRPARKIRSLAPEVPEAIAEVIDKALAFQKAERWSSAKEMREALAKACVDGTGAPIGPLPKTERSAESITGIEATVASSEEILGAKSGVGFDATVDAKSGADSDAGRAALSTAGGVASTRRSATPHAPRPKTWRSIAAVGAGCVLLGAGAYAVHAARAPRWRYCLDVVDTRDGPQCIFEVGADVPLKRARAVQRVTERAGRVVAIDSVTYAGTEGDDFAREDVVRDDSGAVREIVKSDELGVKFEWQKWSDGGKRIDFVDIDGTTPRYMPDNYSEFGWGSRSDQQHTPATSVRVEYDAQGRRVRELYVGPTGRPRADLYGRYGVLYEYGDAHERPVKRTNLGFDGAPAPDTNGTVVERWTESGSPWRDLSYFDANDQPATRGGVHRVHVTHDEVQQISQEAFGLQGEPVSFAIFGAQFSSIGLNVCSDHEWRSSWDPVRHTRDMRCLDESGKLSEDVQRDTYDLHARLALIEYLDRQGNRTTATFHQGESSSDNGVATRSGVSAQRLGYDDRGHRIRLDGLDPTGALMKGVEGFATRESKYDAANNPIEQRFYDEAGHLVPCTEGDAIERATFDDRGLELTRSSFDVDDHPVVNVHGYSSRRSKFDRLRNLVEVAHFGPDGKPTFSDEGFAMEKYKYDENDDIVEISYFDTTGAPIVVTSADDDSGYATIRAKYDERGLDVQVDYLDAHGDPILVKAGYASFKSTRDGHGDVVETLFLGRHGEPVLRDVGYARKKTTYDDVRRPVEVALFDAAGKPVVGTKGWAVERSTYDERGRLVRVDHLDAARAPKLDAEGRAAVVYERNKRGRIVAETSLDIAGKPVVASKGFATMKTAYDEGDDLQEEALFGPDGGPVAGKSGWSLHRQRHDEFHDLIEESFVDVGHAPVTPKDLTYSSKRQRFDERHRLIEVAYFDERGAPGKGPEGVAVVRYVRDAYGRPAQTSFFDGAGAPAAANEGTLVVRSKYDFAGRIVEERFVDASGAPRLAKDSCAGHATRYDPVGRKLEESCLDVKDGAVTLSTEGWALRRTLHDARGNDVDVSTYAPDGTLHADKEGIARRKNRFDERNLLLETTFFDASDKPAHDKRGAHAIRFAYDDSGKKTGETAFDEHDRPIAAKPTKP
ncbi:MAG: protein kinase domain-containing protein [Polyangiaceae bacterium]